MISGTYIAIYEVMNEGEIQRFAEYIKSKAIRLDAIKKTEIDTSNQKEAERILKQEKILTEEVEILYGYLLASRKMKEAYEGHLESIVNQYEFQLNELRQEIKHREDTIETFSSVAINALQKSIDK